jgi:hypothetical protein
MYLLLRTILMNDRGGYRQEVKEGKKKKGKESLNSAADKQEKKNDKKVRILH